MDHDRCCIGRLHWDPDAPLGKASDFPGWLQGAVHLPVTLQAHLKEVAVSRYCWWSPDLPDEDANRCAAAAAACMVKQALRVAQWVAGVAMPVSVLLFCFSFMCYLLVYLSDGLPAFCPCPHCHRRSA